MLKLCLALLSILTMETAMAAEIQKLPAPETTGGKPLMSALSERRSTKEFAADKSIDDQTLSEILWAAYGVNRPDGRRTIPTAMNEQNLQIYVLKADGAWLYEATDNSLRQITEKDLRPLLNAQSYMAAAPLSLVYAAKPDRFGAMHAGSAYQNVGLYAASRGLGNVVRAYYDQEALAKALELPTDNVLISQTLGWPK